MTRVYELFPAELATLAQACRVADLLARIDATLASEDLVGEGSMGQARPHVLLQASVEQRKVLASLLVQLALPEPGEEFGAVRSPVARAAAQARWRGQRLGNAGM